MDAPYTPVRPAVARRLRLRGLDHHLNEWGDASLATAERPTLVLLHGWMDVGASFQFVVDALAAGGDLPRHLIAPDWRGFGLTETPVGDSYWFPDYLGDLDALLRAVAPDTPVDLLGHSMGGNVAMSYAGVRPQRVRRLVNLEGFGLPAARPADAPKRLAQWLDELQMTPELRSYDSVDEVASRLSRNNPRLGAPRAAWLARHWARVAADGRWHILGDPSHKRINPVLYRAEEVVETWRRITAPVLWVEGSETDVAKWWGEPYPRSEFDRRLASVADVRSIVIDGAGHMLHHDRPRELSQQLAAFLA